MGPDTRLEKRPERDYVGRSAGRTAWRRAAALGAAGPMVAAVLALLANGTSALPFTLVVLVLFAPAAARTVRGGRLAPWLLLALGCAYLALVAPFGLVFYLASPASWPVFDGAVLEVTGVLTIVVATLFLRGLRTVGPVVWTVSAIAGTALVVSAVATVVADDPAARPGDLRVLMAPAGASFSCRVPATMPAGSDAVHVENRDTVPHRFLIGPAEVKIRAGGSARMRVALEVGRVEWRCEYVGHGDRSGSSEVR